ncbi:MAG: hypothetical protein Q3M24_04590 [Candidatus Electrothrix aestuarii]|uniref:AAA ATPase domain-containing protein n=1 Tax=Candidatus Electrothrix aestuarii TaxID=3062594 RepID=A0AAU8LYT8_9BACT|nr:hypothetical protein [Candidatus Electrothrix aestuarii]
MHTDTKVAHENKEITIWDAKNRLISPDPLRPGDPLFVETALARESFSLRRLYRELNIDNQGIAHTPPRKQYILFTGHRGCGKSTELFQATAYLHHPDRYYVIHLDCLEQLDNNNLQYADVLWALVARLLEQLEREHSVVVGQNVLAPLENWCKERLEASPLLERYADEIKQLDPQIQPEEHSWLVRVLGKLTSNIKTGATYRDELRLAVRNNYSEFVAAFNLLILGSEEKLQEAGKGQRILFTVDGTDRLPREDATQFFGEDIQLLTRIKSLFVCCAPLHLFHQDKILHTGLSEPVRLPLLKIRDRDGEDVLENMAVMREMALRRVPEQFFDELGTVDYLVRYSGGHPRDLLRLLNVAISYADEDCIDRDAAEKAVKQVANEYRRFINDSDYSRLVQIDLHPDAPDDFTDEKSHELLDNLALLEYGDYFWKSHPLITSLPGYEKAFQVTR